MKTFFEPESAALIGASANKLRPGYHLFRNMANSLGDRFYPINPHLDNIEGIPCYKSILDVQARIDLAVVFIPAASVPEAIEQCAQKGVKAVIIESAGFDEAGPEGRALGKRCLDTARKAGIRLWGPNCMGLLNVHKSHIFSFMNSSSAWKQQLIPGSVALVVQSGMLSAGFLVHIMSRKPFGLSKVCSIGNKIDVDESDLLQYFIDDPETQVIAMYLESIERGHKFFELAKSTKKPIVVLKSGRSPFGRHAAMSHTASLAQDDKVLDGAFCQAHIIRVRGMYELMDVARSLSMAPVKTLPTARVAVLTFSGGAGVVTSDDIYDQGMEVANLSPETIKRLKAVFPEWMDPSNPVDLYPAVEKFGPIKVFSESLQAVLDDPGVDAIFLHIFALPIKDGMFNYDAVSELLHKYQKPLIVWMIGHSESIIKTTQELEKRKIPVVDEIERGARVLAALTIRR